MGVIFAAIATLIISRVPPKVQIGKNIVFHIASNYDGSHIALSSLDKNKTRQWSLYVAKADLNLKPFNPNPDDSVYFENNFSFGGKADEFFYVGFQDKKYSLWKGDFSTGKSNKIFETEKIISYPYVLSNGDIYFLSTSATTKTGAFWDWFLQSSEKGMKQVSNEGYCYYKRPFLMADSILGFVSGCSFSQFENMKCPDRDKLYLTSLAVSEDLRSKKMLNALNEYVNASNSKSENYIQCDRNGDVCISDKTINASDNFTFQHEFFMIEPSGSRKLDISLSWRESFALSGDGKHLFLVGTRGARSEEYFLHKYSRNAEGDFVFVEERRLDFIKGQSQSK